MSNRPIKLIIISSILVLGVLGCKEEQLDVNLDLFDQVSRDLDYDDLKPDPSINYWELWNSFDYFHHKLLYSRGEKCSDLEDRELCLTRVDHLNVKLRGANLSCQEWDCMYFLKAQSKQQVYIIDDREGLIPFLTPIDSRADAIFLVETEGYFFGSTKAEAAIREVEDGYEIIAKRFSSYCRPILVKKYLLKIRPNGKIDRLQSEITNKEKHGCI